MEKRKVKKSFFQAFLKKDSIVKAPHWEFSEESRGLVNIYLKYLMKYKDNIKRARKKS